MTCGRCAGLLVPIISLRYEASTDYVPSADDQDHGAVKCLNCGYRHDSVMARHRRPRPVVMVGPERALSMSYAE